MSALPLTRESTTPLPTVTAARPGASRSETPTSGGSLRERPRRGGRHRLAPEPARHNGSLLWIGQVVNTTGLMMLVPVMPFYVEQLGVTGTAASSTWAGVAIAAPTLALTVATPLWGRVGDRVGRKWMVVRALLGLCLAMIVMALAASPLALVAGRLLQGTLGGVVEAATAFAGAVGPRASRGKALGRSFSATATGSLLGPLVGGALVGGAALPLFMLAVAAAAVAAAVACAFGLREPSREDDPGAVEDGSRSPQRATDRGWRGVPGSGALAVAAVTVYLGIYGLIPVFAARLQDLEPQNAPQWVGALHASMFGASLLASTWWGRRNDRLGRPLITFTMAAAGCAAAIFAQAVISDPWLLVGPRLLLGFCFGALAQSLFLHVGHHSPPRRRSAMVGTANSFLLAGQSAGPLLAGPLLAVTSPVVAIAMMGLGSSVAVAFGIAAVRAKTR